MKHIALFLFCGCFFFSAASGQENTKSILEKSFAACVNLQGGNYMMSVSKKSFNDKQPVSTTADCRFLKVEGDSTSPYKFVVTLSNGDGSLCTSNDLVQLKGSDSTGAIYSRSSNQSMYRGAFQNEGLFPPFFQPQVIFSLDRMDQTTFVLRQGKDEEALGKNCYRIILIDLIRATQPDGQKQEKVFLIDKQTYLPVFYSEKSTTKLNADSLVRENSFALTSLSTAPLHDSLFTFKSIPPYFELSNVLENVYHHHLKTGMTAPAFTGKILGGDSVTMKSFAGKKVLLFFFYRASYPCLKALNALQQFQRKQPDVEVLVIGIDASERDLKELLSKRDITLKAIEDGQAIADNYFVTAAPTFIMVDEKGIITKIKKGFGERPSF